MPWERPATKTRTPNLDALAEEGTHLRRLYTAAPVCHPSRASLLTGRYPHEPGIKRDRYGGVTVQPGVPTVAALLNRAGYLTAFIGKAHPRGDPYDWGFQRSPAYTEEGTGWNRDVRREGRVFRTFHPLVPEGERTVVHGNTTGFLVDRGIQFLEDHRQDRWFLWFATNAPHTPYFYDEDHPYTVPDDHVPPGYPPGAYERHLSKKSPGHPDLERWKDDLWRNYYSHISTLDEHLGRLLRALERTGQARETMVVLLSDNGIMHGSHGFLFKSIWYEEAVRVPGIVRWPGRVEAGRESTALVSTVDLVRTVLEVARASSPEKMAGKNALPLLTGSGDRIRSHVFSEAPRDKGHGGGYWYMVRGERYKYVQFRDRDETYLFDLRSDPHERDNLVDDPDHRAVRRRLRRHLEGRLSPRISRSSGWERGRPPTLSGLHGLGLPLHESTSRNPDRP